MKTVLDFEGKELMPGDTVVFISGPNFLNKGVVTGFNRISKALTLLEVVVNQPNGGTYTMTVAPFVAAKM